MNNLTKIAKEFQLYGSVIDVQEFGNGNINGTYLVTLDVSENKHFILQRINTQVFHQPELVMQNMNVFTQHIDQKVKKYPFANNRRWEIPLVLKTQEQQDYIIDSNGSFWRAISFIEGATTFDTVQDNQHGNEVGYVLGMFHNLISDLPCEQLADTLPGFHITPRYLENYHQVLQLHNPKNPSTDVKYCLDFVRDRVNWAHVLENGKSQGQLCLRPTHGDPKVNNIMIDNVTGEGISIIDLDTVKPGLIHYDIGDCLRSSCNSLGEETQTWENVVFDTDICQTVLQGYLGVAKNFLTDADYKYIYDGIRLIAFELGLRFFTDHLAGDIYFKTKYPEHNLARALVQFKLTESIESQEVSICNIIHELR
ncbi:phosphotransferase enzyme family protein [Calothrix sp. PCC 6303]|uniref:phosphotransferase enzyme family protein n=1 Tax=Calothrix sp. PCC 6303 TaxID=1170562 RepID=UPI0002A05866|nr:aminoglycoside phosphotransferase family protein [Calothrix sp. PCC 6303]AFZ00041.1 aminoglycoside phosphotransferase [Calothrix sp. PCC 6303]